MSDALETTQMCRSMWPELMRPIDADNDVFKLRSKYFFAISILSDKGGFFYGFLLSFYLPRMRNELAKFLFSL